MLVLESSPFRTTLHLSTACIIHSIACITWIIHLLKVIYTEYIEVHQIPDKNSAERFFLAFCLAETHFAPLGLSQYLECLYNDEVVLIPMAAIYLLSIPSSLCPPFLKNHRDEGMKEGHDYIEQTDETLREEKRRTLLSTKSFIL